MSPRKRSEPAPSIAVMDTTLRDGEQTPDVAYSPAEKRQLARLLLLEVQVDRIEIASTRVSEGEKEAAQRVTDWARKARMLQRVEILGYTDGKASVDWIVRGRRQGAEPAHQGLGSATAEHSWERRRRSTVPRSRQPSGTPSASVSPSMSTSKTGRAGCATASTTSSP